MPALASALRQAAVGPVSMMVGSLPITAAARMRARGLRPAFLPPSSLPISISAAPSTMPLELPAWCTWLIFSTVVYLRSAVASKPIWPMVMKLASSLAIASRLALSRMVSSRSSSGRPAMSVTGITARLKCPAARAAAALLVRVERKGVDVGAAEAFHRGDQVGADALRHEAQLVVDARVHRPGAAVGAHLPAAHALDAAAHHQVFEAAGHLGGGEVHALEARWRRSGFA